MLYFLGQAVTTGPSTGIDVTAPGRQDSSLGTVILFSGAPTSVWHRLPLHCNLGASL